MAGKSVEANRQVCWEDTMSRMISSYRGWVSGGCGVKSDGGIEVNVHGVCACRMRKQCVSAKTCLLLFDGGGENGADRTLARLLGRKQLPRGWRNWRNFKARMERQNEMNRFSKEYFKKCKPVVVEIHRR